MLAIADRDNNIGRQAEELDTLICMLICSGHGAGVFDYDYSFFKTAVKTLDKVFKLSALTVTMGVGAILDKSALKELSDGF